MSPHLDFRAADTRFQKQVFEGSVEGTRDWTGGVVRQPFDFPLQHAAESEPGMKSFEALLNPWQASTDENARVRRQQLYQQHPVQSMTDGRSVPPDLDMLDGNESHGSNYTNSSRSPVSMAGMADGEVEAAVADPSRLPLQGRMEYVLSCIRSAGFDSLDSAVTQYYTGTFDESSTVREEQRKSRKRHLRVLLAELLRSAHEWTRWEALGFHEEIMSSAEGIYIIEARQFFSSIEPNSRLYELLTSPLAPNARFSSADKSRLRDGVSSNKSHIYFPVPFHHPNSLELTRG
jgi:hypothetical protein